MVSRVSEKGYVSTASGYAAGARRRKNVCLAPQNDPRTSKTPTMPPSEPTPVAIADKDIRVSGLLEAPPRARACYVLAHGAGAGMTHPFMAAVAAELAQRGIASLRYQFPYMEQGGRRPDPPALAHATVRAAVAETRRRLAKLPLFAG